MSNTTREDRHNKYNLLREYLAYGKDDLQASTYLRTRTPDELARLSHQYDELMRDMDRCLLTGDLQRRKE